MKTFTSLLRGAALAAVASVPGVAFGADTDIVVVLNEDLEVVDPCMTSQSNIGRVIQQNIAETLSVLDTRDGSLQPRLATGWDAVDADTWRFTLREGVSFSDGSDFTAADVKHSFERTLSDKISCEIGAKFFGGMTITTEIVDEHTIDITTDPAQPILPLLMSTLTIVPEETPVAFVQMPVGTGPYTMTERNPGQNITLERRDDYWGEAPEVTKATYVFRADDAVRAAMVETGEADIVPQISEVHATNPALDFAYPNSETTYLRIDHAIAPLDDVRVREALNLAVDREAFLGTLVPAESVIATHMVPPSTLGWDPELKYWPYDPKRAEKLLDEAKEDGVPVDAEITLIGRTGNFPQATEINEALVQMFNDVGFNVKLEMYEVAEWIDFYSKPFAEDRGPRMVTAQHDNSRGDPVFSMYFKYACEGLQSGVCDAELDGMIADATAATGEDRGPLWTKAFDRIHTDVIADVFLFHMVGFSRVSDRLDFTPTIATNSELQLSQIAFR